MRYRVSTYKCKCKLFNEFSFRENVYIGELTKDSKWLAFSQVIG